MFSIKSAGIRKYDRAISTKGVFNFLPLINNSLTTGEAFYYRSYEQSYHQTLSIIFVPFLN